MARKFLLASLLGVLFTTTLGCASAADGATDDVARSDDELTVGSRFRSPLETGMYVADDGSVARISGSLTTQRLGFHLAAYADGTRAYKTEPTGVGEVDVKGNALRVETDACSLEVAPHGTTEFRAVGTCRHSSSAAAVDVLFRKVPKDGFVGRYVSPLDGVELSVKASDDDRLAFTMTSNDVEVFAHEGGGKWIDPGDEYVAEQRACQVRVVVEPARLFVYAIGDHCGVPAASLLERKR